MVNFIDVIPDFPMSYLSPSPHGNSPILSLVGPTQKPVSRVSAPH